MYFSGVALCVALTDFVILKFVFVIFRQNNYRVKSQNIL